MNSALLYYYFKSKEGLYHAVLTRMVETLLTTGQEHFEVAASPEDAVRQAVAAFATFLLHHPRAPNLFAREMLDHEAKHAADLLPRVASGIFERLSEAIRQGQMEKAFRSDLDPRFAAISTIAQVVYFAIARPAVGVLLGHGTTGPPPEVTREFGRHAADFALAALARPRERAPMLPLESVP